MTDSDHALEAIARAANELLPQLAERLARHGLGEIDVTDGDLRLRMRGGGPASATPEPPSGSSTVEAAAEDPSAVPVASPAVGFFVYADGLGPGLEVSKGDAVGHVEMLGVRHDVRAPRAGVVRSLVAETGEAVEYGQVVVELEPAGDGR